MKIKSIIIALMLVLTCFSLSSCGKKDKPTKEETSSGELKIWVGSESQKFYQQKADEYVKKYKEDNGKNFPAKISVKGVDSSSAAATYLMDTEAGADIFTVPHDNLGKLLAGSGSIEAIKSEDLIAQMEDQCSDAFLDVCYLQAGDGSAAKYYAVPYISQALVLMYDKEAFKGKEDKLKTFEGMLEVAKENNKLAVAYTGTDGYNFSNFLLAQPYNDAAIGAFGKLGTLLIYNKGIQDNCYGYGDDQVAIMKYAQRFVNNANGRGGALTSSDGWEKDVQAKRVLSVITGSWNYNSFCTAMGGKDKVGVTTLPAFTLTEADEYGKAKAGMQFMSGSFADCKTFVKKKDSKYSEYLDDILLYLTSDEVQAQSFTEANNLPSSKNVTLPEGNDLAQAQVSQAQYGIPQPFGYASKYNDYYYQKKMPDIYLAIVQNKNNTYGSDDKILNALQKITYVWTKGYEPRTDDVLANWVENRSEKYEK